MRGDGPCRRGHPVLPLDIAEGTQFPRGGFHLFDDDAAIVATDVATATMTAPADIAAYAEIFTAFEQVASFGDEARDHLARIAADYRQLSA